MYGSTTVSETLGDGITEKVSMMRSGYLGLQAVRGVTRGGGAAVNGSVGKPVTLISSALQTLSDQDFPDPTLKAQVPNPQMNDPTCNRGALLAPDKRPRVRGGEGWGLTLALGSQT